MSAIVVADTSVILNFLRIDRLDLLGSFPRRFLATEHVAAEITRPEQQARYAAAVVAGEVDTCIVTDPAEVALFARLHQGGRLGAGECAAIAVALLRGHALAIDDNKAVGRAVREAGLAAARLDILRTPDVMVGLIRAGVLDVAAADAIKAEWEAHHRFRIKATSFQELL